MDRLKNNLVSPVLNTCKVMGSLTAMLTTAQDGAGVDERAADVVFVAGVVEEVIFGVRVVEEVVVVAGVVEEVVFGDQVVEEVVVGTGVLEEVVVGAGVVEEVVVGTTDEDTHVLLEEAPVSVEYVPAPQSTQSPTVRYLSMSV
jgi:hypothetical protein